MTSWQVLQGDVRERLADLDAESIQTCVTSPPYWGLRDYGTAAWEGGDSECDHVEAEYRKGVNLAASVHSTRGGAKKIAEVGYRQYGSECGKCGAKRIDSQLGLEPTPEEYVANLVAVFREVRRVLRDDGTVWLNLGDSYASGQGGKQGQTGIPSTQATWNLANNQGRGPVPPGLKPKDLCGIPWRVAFALQADGWWLRSDIIWNKPNPMPESVTDRPTRSHEYIFLLTKSARYFYDADAIREDNAESNGGRYTDRYVGYENPSPSDTRPRRSVFLDAAGRNKRSVWTVTTQPYPDAHFATFPPKLIEPCILAGSAVGDTILDPFAGSGTTGLVALRHDRSFIGIELNESYCEMARNRIRDDAPLLNVGIETHWTTTDPDGRVREILDDLHAEA